MRMFFVSYLAVDLCCACRDYDDDIVIVIIIFFLPSVPTDPEGV